MKKKLLAGFLSLCIAICGVPAAFAGTLPFRDVASGSWFYDGVVYVYEKGIMNGVSADQFDPDSEATRAMVVSILWRLDGSMNTYNNFYYQDEEQDSWYSSAVNWSAANGIMNGYSIDVFGVNDPITREQLATVLYRYAGAVGCDVSKNADLSGYTDQNQISDYAVNAVSWANAYGLIKGVDAKTLAPGSTATRSQIATIIERFEKIRKGACLTAGARNEAQILALVKQFAEAEMKEDDSIVCDYSNAYIYAQNYKAAIIFMNVHSKIEEEDSAVEAVWVSKETGTTRSIGYFQDYWPAMFDVTTGEVNESNAGDSGKTVTEAEALRMAEECSRTISEDGIAKVNTNDIWVYEKNEVAYIIYVGVRDGYGSGWYDVVWISRATGDTIYLTKTTDVSPGLYDMSVSV